MAFAFLLPAMVSVICLVSSSDSFDGSVRSTTSIIGGLVVGLAVLVGVFWL